MRRHIFLLLAGTMLGACQVQVLTPDAPKKPTKVATKPAPATPSPSASAASPSPSPSASASLAPSPAILPTGPVTTVSGVVKLDAHYLIGQAGGNLIGQAGGNVIAVGGGNVISVGGGNLIGHAGGNVIAVGGGNLIGQAGGNVIATGGGNYSVFQANSVPLGTILPVKGMGVVPVSLSTGKVLGPVVLSDENGAYSITVPESEKENFVVHAVVPGKDADDPLLKDARLHYRLVVTPARATAASALNEDTSVATSYVLRCFTSRIRDIMVADAASIDTLVQSIAGALVLPAPLQPIVRTLVVDLNSDAKKYGFTKTSPNLDAAAQGVSNTVLAHLSDLYTLMTDPVIAAAPGVNAEPALLGLAQSMGVLREATARKVASGYSFEAGVLQRANEKRQAQGLPPYQIKRPSDLGEFVVIEYLANPDEPHPFAETAAVFATMLSDDPALGTQTNGRLRAASIAILSAIGRIMTTDPAAKKAITATLEAYSKENP